MSTRTATIENAGSARAGAGRLAAAVPLAALAFAGLWIAAGAAGAAMAASPALMQAVGVSLIAGAGTGLGGMVILVMRNSAQRGFGTLLAASAGIMLAAALFGLLIPAFEEAERLAAGTAPAWWPVAAGLVTGAGALWLGKRLVEGGEPDGLPWNARRSWLVVSAIALHNVPEGLAVGASHAGDAAGGGTLALAIGLQNVPEGLIVAASLLAIGRTPQAAVMYATATGLVEPVAALFGGLAAGLAPLMLPASMAFAAGAMLWVTAVELIPAARREGDGRRPPVSLLAGFAGMALLGQAL
jgi:ZIP family zinc transporter